MIVRGYLKNKAIKIFKDFEFPDPGPYTIIAVVGSYTDYTFIYLKSKYGSYIGKFSSKDSYVVF